MEKISVAIATFNEEENIASCLSSVASWVDEIVVVDGGSADKTVALAKNYKAKVIITDNPPIFHINKQKAVDACNGEWILQLDADEIVTPELRDEIAKVINSHTTGYYLPRKNFFLGHWLRKGGQYPDYVIRLFRREKGRFPCKSVHEQIAVDGKVGYFKHPLLHYTSRTLGDYWKKADAYTSLTSKELKDKRVPRNLFTYLRYNFVKPVRTFLSLFIRHKGFVDGLYGFLFAFFSALHHPIAFWKYRRLLLLFFLFLTVLTGAVRADYVLPYPSYMPGNKLYWVSRTFDYLKQYWYWGSIASVKYHLALSDKYLVEAKTLFEYKQYLLATDALKRSDSHFQEIPQFIARAKGEGKDISGLEKTIASAAAVHGETLQKLLDTMPAEFIWTPEKAAPTRLPLREILLGAISIRRQQ